MDYYVVTLKVNIRDAKARFSELIERAQEGETVVVCRRNEPVAEIRGVGRPLGRSVFGNPLVGVAVDEQFFEPLPPNIEDAFWFGSREAAD